MRRNSPRAGIVSGDGIGRREIASSQSRSRLDPPSEQCWFVADMDIAAHLHRDLCRSQADRMGHPLLQFGEVDLPMTKATRLARSLATECVQDRHTTEDSRAFVQGIARKDDGRSGQRSKMIPVTVAKHSGPVHERKYITRFSNNAD